MDGISSFLDTFFAEIDKSGLDISRCELDHVAYQASSSEDYEVQKPMFLEMSELAHEGLVGGRRVAVFKLHTPMTYKKYTIPALELIEPKQGQVISSDWQHAELLIDQSFEELMKKYPNLSWDTSSMNRSEFSHLKLNFGNGMTLKFLNHPILETVTN